MSSRRLGGYCLERRIAMGGMAEVWLASGAQGTVAVKIIHSHLASDPEFVTMLADEARIARELIHPNIVRLLEAHMDAEQPYLVMEYVDGDDLGSLLRVAPEKRMPIGAACCVAAQVAAGLAHAHSICDDAGVSLSIVHRDVSPTNVMVTQSGGVKLVDFGIAKARDRASRTATNRVKGKIAYMSPEQAQGRPVDARSDQFSLASLLWECLAGRRLFMGASDLAVMRVVSLCELPSLRKLRPEVSVPLEQCIAKALSRDRDDRYADCADFASALAQVGKPEPDSLRAFVGALPQTGRQGGAEQTKKLVTPSLPTK